MNGLIDGVGKASLLNLYSWRETDLHKGQSHRMTGIYQSREVSLASKLVNQALEATNYAPLNATILKLAPIAIGFALAHLDITEPNTRDILHFLSEHIGHLTHIATAVSALALIVLGQPVVGIATLTCLIAGHIESIQHMLKPYALPLFIITAFMGGGLCEQSIAVLHLLLVTKPYLETLYYSLKNAPIPPPLQKDPRIDFAHFKTPIEEHAPKTEYDLLALFDNADWDNIPSRVPNDARLKGGESIFEQVANWWRGDRGQREVRFLRNELCSLLDSSLSTHAQNQLQCLAEHYAQSRKNDILIDLALHANVCPAGRDEAIRDIFIQYVHQNNLPLKDRIVKALQEYRFNNFKTAYQEAIPGANWEVLRHAIDFRNRHVFNAAMNMCADLGLPELGANNDTIALAPATKALLTPFFSHLQKVVLGVYNKELILEHLLTSIPKEELLKARRANLLRQIPPLDTLRNSEVKYQVLCHAIKKEENLKQNIISAYYGDTTRMLPLCKAYVRSLDIQSSDEVRGDVGPFSEDMHFLINALLKPNSRRLFERVSDKKFNKNKYATQENHFSELKEFGDVPFITKCYDLRNDKRLKNLQTCSNDELKRFHLALLFQEVEEHSAFLFSSERDADAYLLNHEPMLQKALTLQLDNTKELKDIYTQIEHEPDEEELKTVLLIPLLEKLHVLKKPEEGEVCSATINQ